MGGHFVTAFRLFSVVFIVVMAIEGPRGTMLAQKTMPNMHLIVDRFTHFHYSGHAMCDLGHMVGLCGDVGSLTARGG